MSNEACVTKFSLVKRALCLRAVSPDWFSADVKTIWMSKRTAAAAHNYQTDRFRWVSLISRAEAALRKTFLFTEGQMKGNEVFVESTFGYAMVSSRFLYATLLREPVARFVSEYLHTLRGATWLSERLPCPKAQQLRNHYACWNSKTTARVFLLQPTSCLVFLGTNLTEFMNCPFNSAINRQTRMLSSSGNPCLPSVTYSNLVDLETAKRNLQSMEFFGLTEYLSLSQRLFERTSYCRLHRACSFQSYLEQDWSNNQTGDYLEGKLSASEIARLRQMNSDDIELYQFARQLFFQRTCQILAVACQ